MKLRNLTLCALAMIGLMACNDSDKAAGKSAESGYLTFSVATYENVDNVTRAQISIDEATGGYTVPSAADFTISITDEDGYEVWSGLLGEWNSATPLKVGIYTVKASYDNGSTGFNKPVFASEPVSFTIAGAKQTDVTIPVTLQNAIVRFNYTEMFLKYYSFDKVTVTSSTSTSTPIEFTKDVTKGAFIDATSFNVATTLTSQSGKNVQFSKDYNAKTASCYTITFDASNIGGVGTITITFNDEVTTIEMGDIELNE